MKTIGQGFQEIRIKDSGAFRMIYLAKFADAVYVLPEKDPEDCRSDLDIATERFQKLLKELRR